MESINVEAEKKAYALFIKAGMTPEGACGLIGNLEAESDGFYPTRVEYLLIDHRMKEKGIKDKNGNWYTHDTYTKAVDSGYITEDQFLHPIPGCQYGYGLAQWTSPGRKAGLYNLAHKKGVSIGDMDMQLEFLLSELKTAYPKVLAVLKSATSIRVASDKVLIDFEQPSSTADVVKEGRAKRGQTFFNNYVKNSTGCKEVTMATHYISNCGHDENWNYSGGMAGDQNGEWEMKPWYPYPWDCVLRHPDAAVRAEHAAMAESAAKNDNIGYDQGQRDTFGIQLKAVGDDPAKIKVKCETDCSKGIIDITKAIGRKLKRPELANIPATYTGNMRQAYKNAGYKVLTESKYLTSPDYLMPGDILLNDANHVATNISQGSKASAANANASVAGATANSSLIGSCTVTLKTFVKGASDNQIRTIQILLSQLGYKGKDGKALKIDGELGDNTAYAVEQFQRKQGMSGINFGTVAAKTWQLLLSAK